MWWLYLIKFIACVIAIFATTLFLSSLVKSIIYATMKDEASSISRMQEESYKDAKFRLLVGIIMSICWAIVIVF